MAFEERNAWSALIACVISFGIFGRPIWVGTAQGRYADTNGLSIWAWDVIWLIGGGIAVGIAVVIAFQIAFAILTRTPKPQFISDERDLMINRRGALVTLVVISAGFILAVGLLAWGMSALAALNTILAGMAAGAIAAEIYRVAIYRFGF